MALFATQNFLWRLPNPSNNSVRRALLADALALNYPDPGFVANLTDTLARSGYHVDYWGPSSTTVDQFRNLPSLGYDLIIIRSHIGSSAAIITTQLYHRTEYTAEQVGGGLVPAQVENSPIFFALTAGFVRQDMVGRFAQSTVVVMGCAALQARDLASSFLDKGANFFVGWDGSVTMIHTDTQTATLTQELSRGLGVPEATSIAGDVDPVSGARLAYLDWNGLVQGRINDLESRMIIWIFMAGILVLGPSTVFVAPRLVGLLESVERAVGHARHKSRLPKEKD